MDFDTIDTDIWTEIQDMQGEIFDLDIPELREDDFNFNDYVAADYDY